MNKRKGITILVSLIIIVLPLATAFANTFLEDKTMELWKGETGKYCVYLQNTGEEDLVQVIRIFDGQGYIKNLKEINKEFNVLVGTVSDDLPVCMKLKLPNDAEKGEKYIISYGVAGSSSNDQEGMVSLAPVQIREKFYLTERLDKRPVPVAIYVVFAFIVIALSGALGYKIHRKRKLKLPGS